MQGEALAWKRREAMLELIERGPARALALAAPFRWRAALPSNDGIPSNGLMGAARMG